MGNKELKRIVDSEAFERLYRMIHADNKILDKDKIRVLMKELGFNKEYVDYFVLNYCYVKKGD